jgi:hypothetical protein
VSWTAATRMGLSLEIDWSVNDPDATRPQRPFRVAAERCTHACAARRPFSCRQRLQRLSSAVSGALRGHVPGYRDVSGGSVREHRIARPWQVFKTSAPIQRSGETFMKLRRPSPALVISIVALVAACAGSAVAATVITSAQIKNETIQNQDIKKGTIQSGRLSKGLQNILLKKSAPAPAPRIAYEQVRKAGPENQPANQMLRVASVMVPAGAYVVTANTIMTAFTGTSDIIESLLNTNAVLNGTCTLDFGGVQASGSSVIAVNNRQAPSTIGIQLTRTIGAPTEILLKCAAPIPWRSSESSIIATKVDTITQTVEK